jgi:ribonuclease P protein component
MVSLRAWNPQRAATSSSVAGRVAASASRPLSQRNNSRFSLGYERRLHYRWEFRRFFDQNQVLRLSECTIFRIPNELGHFRLGVTLKSRGTSVERNRVKRAVREGFRQLADRLGSFDYNVVIPSGKKLGFPYPAKLAQALKSELPDRIEKGFRGR